MEPLSVRLNLYIISIGLKLSATRMPLPFQHKFKRLKMLLTPNAKRINARPPSPLASTGWPGPPGSAHSCGMPLVSQRLHFHKRASCSSPVFHEAVWTLLFPPVSTQTSKLDLSWQTCFCVCFFPPYVCVVIGPAGPASAQLLSLVR